MTGRLSRLLAPKSIAMIGGRHAAIAVRQCRALGYSGRLYGVNPNRTEIDGIATVARVADLPEVPDAALVAVPAEASIPVVADLSAMGAGGAVCFAIGFAEAGAEGRARQDRLMQAAGSMPVVGPNCTGLVNYRDGAALWPDEQGGERCERGAAILSQSGNVAINITMQDRSVPLSYVVSLGNQAGVTLSDYIAALAEDESVTAIGLYLEQIPDLQAFTAAVRTARLNGVPVVAMKLGRSVAGARSVASHTSALAGSDRLYDALFDRLGVVRVGDIGELLETVKLLTVSGIPSGDRLVTLSCSGGEAALIGDLAERRELTLSFPQPDAVTAQRLADQLAIPIAGIGNPLDYNTMFWGQSEPYAKAFRTVLESPIDMAALILDIPRADRCSTAAWEAAADAFIDARRSTGVYGAVIGSLAEGLPPALRRQLIEAGITPLQGLGDGLAALGAAAWLATKAPLPKAITAPYGRLGRPDPQDKTVVLNEGTAKARLSAYGVRVPESRVIAIDLSLIEPAEAVAAAVADIGGPVALKAIVPGLVHKSDVGAVVLDPGGPDAAGQAALAMARQLSDAGHQVEAVLVEAMAPPGVAELIVGVTTDAPFGPALVIGSGGVLAELLDDSAVILLPTSADQIRERLERLRVWPILAGFRGRPKADIGALVAAIEAVAAYAADHRDELVDMDINPLIVGPEGEGVWAVDAVIRLVK